MKVYVENASTPKSNLAPGLSTGVWITFVNKME